MLKLHLSLKYINKSISRYQQLNSIFCKKIYKFHNLFFRSILPFNEIAIKRKQRIIVANIFGFRAINFWKKTLIETISNSFQCWNYINLKLDKCNFSLQLICVLLSLDIAKLLDLLANITLHTIFKMASGNTSFMTNLIVNNLYLWLQLAKWCDLKMMMIQLIFSNS